jgi:hypothetical protein
MQYPQTFELMLVRGIIKSEVLTIASMSGVLNFNTFRMKGLVQGQRSTMLIDGGASHNFIDMAMVERRHIPTFDFEGFLVEVAGGSSMACDKYIP